MLLSCSRLRRVVCIIYTLLRVVEEHNDVPVAMCKRLTIEKGLVLNCLFGRRRVTRAGGCLHQTQSIRWLISREKDHLRPEVSARPTRHCLHHTATWNATATSTSTCRSDLGHLHVAADSFHCFFVPSMHHISLVWQ